MDSILPLLITLFILSMISERIVNYIKLQYSNKRFFGIRLKNLKDASLIGDVEDARTKRILVLNIFIGTLIAIALRADLITIMKHINHPSAGMGWTVPMSSADHFTWPVGCLLTGCFLSLGSKFWHDLLDLILEVKEYKRSLVQRNRSAEAEGIAPATNTDRNSYKAGGLAAADLAIRNNHTTLSDHFPNIRKMIPCFEEENGSRIPCVDICLADRNTAKLPAYLPYKNGDGTISSVKVRLIPGFKPVRPQAGTGEMIFNVNSPARPGTLGCLVSDSSQNVYALTCNHVMTANRFESPGNLGEEAHENLGAGDVDLGSWTAGVMDDKVDAALIQLTNPANAQPNGLNTGKILTLQESDSGTPIQLNGAFSKQQQGFVIHVNNSFSVQYDDKLVDMHGLITVSSTTNANSFSCVTQEGDSGSLVYHAEKRQPIGLVLGANDQFTYVIPLQAITAAFRNLQLSVLT